MLQRIRESLVLLLLALLPFHAFLVTFGTKLVLGQGHAPMGVLAVWKEGLLIIILILAAVEFLKTGYGLRVTGKVFQVDFLDVLILALFFICVVLLVTRNSQPATFVLGFKYDFLPLVAFLVLRRVPWSESFGSRIIKLLLILGSLVAILGVLWLLLPDSVLRAFGYSDLHSLYVPGGSLAPFQELSGTGLRRMQSAMSGPNQLGLWMLLPWSAALTMLSRLKENDPLKKWVYAALVFSAVAIVLSFSRAAWIAAAAITMVSLWLSAPRKIFVSLSIIFASLGVIILATLLVLFPGVLLRETSNAGHITRPIEAIQKMIEHPLGLGLGSAGPASNRLSDSCQDFPAGSDVSWAKAHPELCIFVDGTQVQPTDRTCTCPFLPENWFLQIGVELGWLGMILWFGLVVAVVTLLWGTKQAASRVALGAFLGITTAGLFLHSWEDGAVALTLWILMAACLHKRR